MVKTNVYIFFFLLIIFTGCGKNEFNLEFNLGEDITENYNVTYYATDLKGGLTVQAVASVRNGKCDLNGLTKRPTFIYITPRQSHYPLVILANRGEKINITGSERDPLSWDVVGNEINQELSQWRKENILLFSNNENDSVNSAVRTYVENNPGNPVSTILMLCYYDRRINEKEYSTLMASLKGEAKNEDWLTMIGRSDQLIHQYFYPARLESLIMRSVNENGDTLAIDNKNPVFILFWQTGYTERKNMIDSLKVLKKQIPDTSILIADVCVDIDSVAWRNAIRRDSIEPVKRLWAPLGMNDPAIMKMKVSSLPFFIVLDSAGNQTYRGKELEEAIKEYRQLSHK